MKTYKTNHISAETFAISEVDTNIPLDLLESVRRIDLIEGDYNWIISPILVTPGKEIVEFACIYREDPLHSENYRISIEKFNR